MLQNRENIFYLAMGVFVVIFELSVPSGLYACVTLPLVLGVIAVGFWAFKPND